MESKIVALILVVLIFLVLLTARPSSCAMKKEKEHKIEESSVELFGTEQYINIKHPYQRVFYRIDLKMVKVHTIHKYDEVTIWDVDEASNVASTYTNFYNYYEMPDTYLPAAGMKKMIHVVGKADTIFPIASPVKQVLVEVRLHNKIPES